MKTFMGEKEISLRTSFKLQTLRNHRHLGKGLPYLKVGRKILYDWDDVVEYLETKKIYPERGQ